MKERAMRLVRFWSALRRDVKIASVVAMALLGLLTFVDKYWPSLVSDPVLDFLRWLASLGGLIGLV